MPSCARRVAAGHADPIDDRRDGHRCEASVPPMIRNVLLAVSDTLKGGRGRCARASVTVAQAGVGTALWVPETPQTSCDLLILVDGPAEAVVSLDLVGLG